MSYHLTQLRHKPSGSTLTFIGFVKRIFQAAPALFIRAFRESHGGGIRPETMISGGSVRGDSRRGLIV